MEVRVEHPTDRPNFVLVALGPELELAFSYRTVIGFRTGSGWVLSENLWGPTTGKHLNWLPGSNRVPRAEFETRLGAALARFEARA